MTSTSGSRYPEGSVRPAGSPQTGQSLRLATDSHSDWYAYCAGVARIRSAKIQ